MPDITIFEFHSHGDAQFGSSALPGVGSDDKYDADDEFEYETDDEEGSSVSPVAVLIALGLLVGLAVAAKKLRGSDEDEVVPLEESDDLTATADD